MDNLINDVAVPGPQNSAWIPKNEMLVPAPEPTPPKRQPSSALVLAVLGQEVVRVDIPVLEPGIVMFPGLEFTFTNVPCRLGFSCVDRDSVIALLLRSYEAINLLHSNLVPNIFVTY